MDVYFLDETEAAKSVLSSWVKIMEFFQTAEGPGGEKFNHDAEVPGTEYELWWFDERVLAVGNLLLSLKEINIDAGAPLPEKFITELTAATDALSNEINSLAAHVIQVNNDEISALAPSSWMVHTAPRSQQYNFASLLQNLKPKVEDCLVKYYSVASIGRTDKFNAFAEAVREFSEKAKKARTNTKAIEKAKEKIEKMSATITALKKKGENNKDAMTQLLEESQAQIDVIGEAKAESSALLENIQGSAKVAVDLDATVQAYQKTFMEFQVSLDSNNTAYNTLHTQTNELFSELAEKDENIATTIEQANEMLKGATNAGLATTFSDTLSDLNTSLRSAKSSFHWAIGLLVISAIPLAAYLILAPIEVTTSQGGESLFALSPGSISPATTLALALLMVPMIWLAKFAAARHHQLFQLKEHYQYKYTLAMAVDGFKKQAPSHADEIAAETFFQLTFNPADKLTGKGGVADHPSPLMNWIMNKTGMNDRGAP